jgi:hypothetical protein
MLYAPLHTMIWQTPGGGTRFTFDRPSKQFASFGTPQITEVGRELDHNPAALLDHLGLEVPDQLTGSSGTDPKAAAAVTSVPSQGRSLRRLRLCTGTAAGAYQLARFVASGNNGTGVGFAIVDAYGSLTRTAHGNRKFPKRGHTFPPAEAGGPL